MEFLADVDDELDYNEDDVPSTTIDRSCSTETSDRLRGQSTASHSSHRHIKSMARRRKPSEVSSASSHTSSSPREEGEAYSDEEDESHVSDRRHESGEKHGGSRSSRRKYPQTVGDREEGEASSDDEFHHHHQSTKVPRKYDQPSAPLVSTILSSEEAEAHYRHRLHERYTQRRRGEELSRNSGGGGDDGGSESIASRRVRDVNSTEPVHLDGEKESRRPSKSKKSSVTDLSESRSNFTVGNLDERRSPGLVKSKSGRFKSEEQAHRDDHQQGNKKPRSKSSRSAVHAKQEATKPLDDYQTPGLLRQQQYDTSPTVKLRSAVVFETVSRSYSTSYLTLENADGNQQDNIEVYYGGKVKRSQKSKITVDCEGQFDDQENKGRHSRSKKSKRDRRNKDDEEKRQGTTENDLRQFLLSQQQQQQQQQQQHYSKHRPASMTHLDEYANWNSSHTFNKYRVAALRMPSKRGSPSPNSPNPSPIRSTATSPASSRSSSLLGSPPREPRFQSAESVTNYSRRSKEGFSTEGHPRDYQQQRLFRRRGRTHDHDSIPTVDDDDDSDGAPEATKRARKYATVDTFKQKPSSDLRSNYPVSEKHGKYSDNVGSVPEELSRRQRKKKPSPSPTNIGLDSRIGGDANTIKLEYDEGRDHRRQNNPPTSTQPGHRHRRRKRSPFPTDDHSSNSSNSSSTGYTQSDRGKLVDRPSGQPFDKRTDDAEKIDNGALDDSAVKQSPSMTDEEEPEIGVGEKQSMEVANADAKPKRPLPYTGPAHIFSESESDGMSGPEMLSRPGAVEDILLQPRQTAEFGGADDDHDGETRIASAISPPPQMLYPSKPFYYPSIQGCRSVEEFECLNRIEEGTYGVVYRARDKKINEIVALKRLKMEKERDGFPITSLREINTLMKAQHENIVTVREIVVGSNMDKIYLVMDYVEHDLKSLMEIMNGPFSVGEVKCLLVQLLRAVRHLHDNWILHRDLKTSNLLLSHQGILKVGDFGLAREYGSPLKHYTEVVVTLWYRAPELLLGVKQYTCPIDLWSVGCIFAEFLLQRPLFPGKGEVDELNIIFRDLGTPTERIWPGVSQLPGMKKCVFTDYPYNQLRRRFTEKQISDQGFDLLNSFLTYCPDRRITADKALNHAYFTERPRAIHHSMFPSWPAKSEGGVVRKSSPRRPPGGGALAAAANAAAASGGEATRVRYQPPAPPMGGQRFYSSMGDSRPGTAVGSGPDYSASSGVDRGFLLRF